MECHYPGLVTVGMRLLQDSVHGQHCHSGRPKTRIGSKTPQGQSNRTKRTQSGQIHQNPKPQKQHFTTAVRVPHRPCAQRRATSVCPRRILNTHPRTTSFPAKKRRNVAERRHPRLRAEQKGAHTRMCEPRAAKDPARKNRQTENCSQPATNQEEKHADEAGRRCEEKRVKERTIEGRPAHKDHGPPGCDNAATAHLFPLSRVSRRGTHKRPPQPRVT